MEELKEAGGGGGCVDWNQYYTACTIGPTNPFHGAVSFDNIGLAWVAIFLVISLEVGSSSLIGPHPSDTVLLLVDTLLASDQCNAPTLIVGLD